MANLKELSKTTEERLSSGHRLCAGCGASIVVRQVLMATKDPAVIPALFGGLEKGSAFVLGELAKFGSAEVELLALKGVQRGTPGMRKACLNLLQRVGTKASLATLRPLTKSKDFHTRVATDRAIKQIEARGGKVVAPKL